MTPVARFSTEETLRVARLARLALSAEEGARLAEELSVIASSFAGLAEGPTGPPDDATTTAPPRADVALPPSSELSDAILAQAPRVDAATRLVRAPRGVSE